MKNRVTIKDIAVAANCSINCVSRALMDASDISERRKAEIRALADRMGYVFNRNAAALRHGRSKVIGVVLDSFLNPYYSVMINYLWDRLNRSDYTVIVFRHHGAAFETDLAKQIISANAGGVIAFSPPAPAAQELLDRDRIAVVVIGRDADGLCANIVLDDYLGGKMAAEHFMRVKVRAPMYLGETRLIDYSVERGRGFGDAFSKNGVEARIVSRDDVEDGDFTKYIESLYQKNDLPDSIFCFNDFVAYEMIKVLHRLRVTGIDVIGYDDIQREIVMPIAINTIGYDKRNVAERAIDLLFASIGKEKSGPQEKVVVSELEFVQGEPF